MNSLSRIYRYWRIRVFYSIYIGYIVYYFTRSSFKILGPLILESGIIDSEGHGVVLFYASIAYAISKFLCGILADLYNPRILMSFGLIASGAVNIAMSGQNNFYSILMLWSLNGLIQGLGWPPVAKMLTKWYTKKERGSWWGLWSTSHNVGEFLLPLILIFNVSDWRQGLYLPGVIGVLTGLFLLNRLRSSPSKIGLPDINEYMSDSENEVFNEVDPSFKQVLYKYILTNSNLWVLISTSCAIYYIRGAIYPFLSIVMIVQGYSKQTALLLLSAFEFGGFFGSLGSGFLSDKFFQSRRGIVNMLFSLGILVTSYAIWQFSYDFYILIALSAVLGFFVYGPQMLLGVAVAEVCSKQATSTATGFAGLWSYLAYSISFLVVPHLSVDQYFISLIFAAAIAVVSLIPMLKSDYVNEEQ